MLFLVLAYGNRFRLIQQYVRRHEHGIIEKPHVYVFGIALALFLKLSHAARLAELSVTVKHPSEFGVSRNVRLQKQHALFGIYAERKIHCEHFERVFAKYRRLQTHRYAVQVRNAVHAVVCVLHGNPIFERARIASERWSARRFVSPR